ncbi:MAG: phosphoglucosamine mutase [Planctomycetota bacterium]|nr:phosphoglucosamine mutase [Planctomycetota bacterium]
MDRLMVTVSGVRGTIGQSLTPLAACQFGLTFGTILGRGKTVVVGADTRPSGPMLRGAILSGLLATGVNVVDLGVASTPAIALATRRLRADGGIIITASHNPIEYNGIKFLQPTGTGLDAQGAADLKAVWEASGWTLADSLGQGRLTSDDTAAAAHVEAVCNAYDVAAIATKRFTVVVDSVNGAGCGETPMLLQRLGCRLIHINSQPHGLFAHPPEPVEENISELLQAVRDNHADVGFAQDADADRLAIVDETGRFIGEEYTLALAAGYALARRPGPVATNLVTSRMIDDVAAAAGARVVRAPTGEANVISALLAHGCVFAGEGGGGAIDPAVGLTRDSLVGIACLLGRLADTDASVSQLVDSIPRYVMRKTKMPCPLGAAEKVVALARSALACRPGATLNDADGLRVDLPGAWVAVRASNTEPILRIIAEAPDASTVDALVAQVTAIARTVIR